MKLGDTGDPIYDRCPWTTAIVTRLAPNVPLDEDMKYIADNIHQWASVVTQTGKHQNPQMSRTKKTYSFKSENQSTI